MSAVSVIIVNHNGGKILLECVRTALRQAHQVIVVDNASSDGSLSPLLDMEYSGGTLTVLQAGQNLGFAAACNLGAQGAAGSELMFLNPDCVLEEGTIGLLDRTLQKSQHTGMAGPLLLNPDGTEQAGGRRAVPTPWRSFVRAFGLSFLKNRYPKIFSDFILHNEPFPDRPVEVEAISGACMLVKREAMEHVGPMDEGYFLHCEDLDWCMRFRRKNWKIMFVPDAMVVHHKGICSKSRPLFVEWHKHKGMMRFYQKFFRHQYPGVLMWIVALGVWIRFGALATWYSMHKAGSMIGIRHE